VDSRSFVDVAGRHELVPVTTDALLCIDRETGRIVSGNERLENLTGWSLSHLVGEQAARLYAPACDDPRRAFGPHVWEDRGLHEDVLLARVDGFSASVSIRVEHVERDGMKVAVCVIRDETERRMLERELITKHLALRDAHGQLQAKVAELDSVRQELVEQGRMTAVAVMAASVAHDLRTPLAVLAANRQYLKEVLGESSEPELRLLLEDDRAALDAIKRILDGLRDFSAESAESRPVAVTPVLDRCARLLRRRIDERDVALHIQAAPQLHARITAVELGQVLTNLLNNAVDVTPRGAAVEIEAEAEHGQVRIFVRDDGPGVPESLSGHLFQPFQSSKTSGMGLGLCISRQMARRHGGDLRFVGNGVGARAGACFEVRLQAAHG
jgi:two-component system C4-dicarboxylate transport sensor histidine kinase DctB